MALQVFSEITPLRRVLLHRPGGELLHLSPDTLQRLLFDDIPYLARAQEEHDAFAELLRSHGVEVCYLDRLTADVLDLGPGQREAFVRDAVRMSGVVDAETVHHLTEHLLGITPSVELVRTIMRGIHYSDVPGLRGQTLARMLGQDPELFILDPMPNLYFTRDPFATIGRGASLHRMHAVTRQRETLFARTILTYHPDFADVPRYYTPDLPLAIEGGDILNFSPEVLGVGLSLRTAPGAVEDLARTLFADPDGTVRTLLAFAIPHRRAFMHLDTVFTQVDRDTFVVHPAILPSLRVFRLTPSADGQPVIEELRGALEAILGEHLNLDRVHLIPCGGDDLVAAEREQWNDGSNTLAIRPGTVVVYERNTVTNRLLDAHGIEILPMPSSELSRGRGGPRCMSMPLVRDLP